MENVKKLLNKRHDYSIQYQALYLLLFFSMIFGTLAALINLLLKPSVISVMLPFAGAVISALLFFYSINGKHPYIAKIVFLIFMDFVFFPLGWISTSGSLSSMPYYSVLFLIVTFLLIEYKYEYILPVLYMIFAIFLMYAEIRWPNLVAKYEPTHLSTLSAVAHYIIVALFIGIIFTIILQKFMDVQGGYTRKHTRDELTGLYTRTYGMQALKKAHELTQNGEDAFTLALLSVEGLKDFNQIYGSLEGDQLLKELAAIMIRNTRTNDVSTRYSGNRFMIILNHSNSTQIDGFLSRLNYSFNTLAKTYPEIPVKLLVGTAGFDYNSINDVLKAAEKKQAYRTTNNIGGLND